MRFNPDGLLRWCLSLLVGLLASASCPPLAIAGQSGGMDGIVATVSWQTITRSAVIAYRDCFEPKLSLIQARDAMIAQMLISNEATRYGWLPPLNAAPPDSRRFGLSSSEWQLFDARRHLAQAFLAFRLSVDAQPDPLALQRFFESNRQRWAGSTGPDDPAVREAFRSEQRALQTHAYIEELRARSDVQLCPDWPE